MSTTAIAAATTASNAACLGAGLEDALGPLAMHKVLIGVAGSVRRVVYFIGSDKASGCVRRWQEIRCMFMPYKCVYVLLMYCWVHPLHSGSEAEVKANGLCHLCSSLPRLMKSSYYKAEYLAAIATATAVVCKDKIKRVDRELAAERIRECERFVERVFRLTVFRTFRIRAAFHRLSPRPLRPSFAELDLRTACDAMKELWHVNPSNFTTVVAIVGNNAASDRQLYLQMIKTYCAVARRLVPVGDKAETRWEFYERPLCFVVFATMLCRIGIQAWLIRWRPDKMRVRAVSDILQGKEGYTPEQTRRIARISTTLSSDSSLVMAGLQLANLEPTDRLCRYLEAHDLDSNHGVPLIFVITCPERSPMRIALTELANAFHPDPLGDGEPGLMWFVLESWLLVKKYDMDFFQKYVEVAFQMDLHQGANISKLKWQCEEEWPLRTWGVYAALFWDGAGSARALDLAKQTIRAPRCCQDDGWTWKVIDDADAGQEPAQNGRNGCRRRPCEYAYGDGAIVQGHECNSGAKTYDLTQRQQWQNAPEHR